MLNNVEQFSKANEYEAQQVRIQELEIDLSRYRSTVETQLGLLPATTVSATTATRRRSPTPAARPEAALATPVKERYLTGKG